MANSLGEYCICSLFNYGDIGDNIHYNKALYKSLIIECLAIEKDESRQTLIMQGFTS